MKFGYQYLLIILVVAWISVNRSFAQEMTGELDIESLILDYPSPGIPFYHFQAQVQLPHASIIEVRAIVNGKELRSTDLYRSADALDLDYPPLTQRPPSGYGLSQDATMYENPMIVGWVAWEPGETYTIELQIRLKQEVVGSEDDEWISASVDVDAPEGPGGYDSDWARYKSIVLSETAGIDRNSEPVEVLLGFYPDEVTDLKREIRVVALDPEDHTLKEVPCQVYDIQSYEVEDDLAPDENGNPTRDIPLWFPTVSARVAFLADVKANTSQVYHIYYQNPNALSPVYKTNLSSMGELPGLFVDNGALQVHLHPKSGHLDQISLSSRPEVPLFHRLETNGAIHWNPEVYSPPRPWTHTSDWDPVPNIRLTSGPVKVVAEMWGPLRDIPEASASVRYQFYPDRPYFISSTTLRIDEPIWSLAVRNGEIVFRREMMTHAAWYDEVRGRVMTYEVTNMPDLTDIKIEADVPWITFYNEETGVGFAGINLQYANGGVENRPRLLNPYLYITGGPWIYWARALILPFLSSNMQQMFPAQKGSIFMEKWAFLMYETSPGTEPWAPVIDWDEHLKNPLRIHLMEEVDDRVSRSVHEVLVEDGKTGWENRDTKRK